MQDIENCNGLSHKKREIPSDIWDKVLIQIEENKFKIKNNKDLTKFKLYMQNTYKIVLSNSELIKAYNQLEYNIPELRNLFIKKKSKSNSGVIVVTVLTSAHPEYIDENGVKKITKFSCAWNCHYCPNEKASEENNWIDQPRSYLFQEPAVLRANENNFDAILQFRSRISNLIDMGHNVDKIELLILGVTWCSYHEHYQERFISELYYAANTYFDKNPRQMKSLEDEILENESGQLHIIGITLETRPDTITMDEIKKFRKYNATRIQLGVQHTDNYVLKKINRGHNIECVYEAIRMLKENCFKVDIHLMPNLPGASPEKDIDMLRKALYDVRLQADQLKIYPCAVVPFTKIKEWYDNGEFIPYDDTILYEIIKDFKKQVQPYKRLNRIIRDIPSSYISAGYKSVNMRQMLQNDMKKHNWCCKCIRCREIGARNISDQSNINLYISKYRASEGDEYFISYETTEGYLIGFIRLRINTSPKYLLETLQNTALIRELHVYSNVSIVGTNEQNSFQHRGFGKNLVLEAEKIAKINNIYKIAIISGTGVRNYYRTLGYELENTYMTKTLQKPLFYRIKEYCDNIIS